MEQTPFVNNNFQSSTPKHSFDKKSIALGILCVLLLLSIGFVMYRNTKRVTNLEQQIKAKDEEIAKLKPNSDTGDIDKLIENVAKMLSLPTGETPTVATVTDLSKLAGQEFFAKAQVGDKVLIYTNSKKAILYRPSENKIIEVAPISSQPQQGNVAGEQVTK